MRVLKQLAELDIPWNRNMIKKLRAKFILIAMSSIIAVLTVIMGVINYANYRELSRDADIILEYLSVNNGLFPQITNPIEHDAGAKNSGAAWSMSPETPYETRFFSVTTDLNGEVIRTNTGSIAAVGEDDAAIYAESALSGNGGKGYVDNYRYLISQAEDGYFIVFLDRSRELNFFKSFLTTSALVSLVGIVAVFMLVLIFSRKATRPIAESYEKQKRFITDAGHELKTPLTIIDASTEVLELEQGENRWTMSIRNQVKRLASLTENLVSLTRMDESESTQTMVDFSLSDAVAETADTFVAPARLSSKSIELDIEQNISYTGDENSIRRLISILLDNAIKYSSSEAAISISLKRQGKYSVIVCRNPVDSISRGDLDILFERFYRGDSSRGAEKAAGYGIGLSMARAIVTAHKGRIRAKSDDGVSVVITAII